jgi:hypothetical protein
MRVKKIITTGIRLDDPAEILDEDVLLKLKARFEGKCYRETFIVEVVRILSRGLCDIGNTSDLTAITLNVTFEVIATHFVEGEIITGCVILKPMHKKKDEHREYNGIIICKAQNACISISANEKLKSLKEEQIVSVRVAQCAYPINSKDISVVAYPFLPMAKFTVYKIKDWNLSHPVLQDVLARIKEQEAVLSEKPSSDIDKFRDLLYTYKTKKEVKHFNMLTGNASGYVGRDPHLDLFSPNCAIITLSDNVIPLDVGDTEAILMLLENYYTHIKALCEMHTIYSKKEVFDGHLNMWNSYKNSKLDG